MLAVVLVLAVVGGVVVVVAAAVAVAAAAAAAAAAVFYEGQLCFLAHLAWSGGAKPDVSLEVIQEWQNRLSFSATFLNQPFSSMQAAMQATIQDVLWKKINHLEANFPAEPPHPT